MISKSEMARRLHVRGISVDAIAHDLDMTRVNVRKAISRPDPEQSRIERKKITARRRLTEGPATKGAHTHQLIQPFKRKPAHRGSCVAWTVRDGGAQQCGKACKGQLCDEHAHTTLPAGNTLGRRATR